MGKCNIRINIEFTNSNGEMETHQVEVETVLPESGPKIIDNVEKTTLELNKDAIRQAVSTYMEELSKKKPELSKDIKEEVFKQILLNTESTEQ
jgi:actin-like ATPase involved in cell morphogenesis